MDCIRIEQAGDIVVFTAPAEISVECSHSFKNDLKNYFENNVFKSAVFDISALQGINSCGIGLMVTLQTKCMSLGCMFYLCNPTTNVTKTLELVQLKNFFNIVEEIDEIPGYGLSFC